MGLVQSHLLFLQLLLLISTYLSFAYPHQGLKLSAIRREANSFSSDNLPSDYETHYYPQTLDHFNYYPESYTTFQQRYILSFKYWGGANTSSPVFVYLGEGNIEDDVLYVSFISELASRFKGLVLFIEHRYYGESLPFGTREKTFKNASTRGYLSSEQALADYAQIITHVKKNLSALSSPVIAVGASYGGSKSK
ncbi:Lysosomal Pro-X carboxypeptidase [Euphorbia peplus]|nr:Lysosomal Pro-X carboxypeptidase [Euphorbia peplus]